MDTEAIRAVARQLKAEAEKRTAEAIGKRRLEVKLRDAAYAAELTPQDISDDTKLKEKAREWQQLGKVIIECGLAQYVDDMPECDGALKINQGFVKGLAKLICAEKSSRSKIFEHLRAIREFADWHQRTLCQWTWNHLIPVLCRIRDDKQIQRQETTETVNGMPSVPPGVSRRKASRDHTFLFWFDTPGEVGHGSHAEIRDRWNQEHPDQQVGNGDKENGRDTVKKAIDKAREETIVPQGKRKPR